MYTVMFDYQVYVATCSHKVEIRHSIYSVVCITGSSYFTFLFLLFLFLYYNYK